MKSLARTVHPPSKPSLHEWMLYINHPSIYANTAKYGGVGYEDAQNELIKDAKSILSERSERIKADRIAYIILYILMIIIAIIF